MKGRNYILLFAWATLTFIAAGCSIASTEVHDHSDGDHAHEISEEDMVAIEYFRENFPTREQELQVRECTTSRTGYEFDPLPDDFGPGLVGTPAPRTGRKIPNEVHDVSLECVFDLGLEDRFYLPWNHETLRGYLAWRAERNS